MFTARPFFHDVVDELLIEVPLFQGTCPVFKNIWLCTCMGYYNFVNEPKPKERNICS